MYNTINIPIFWNEFLIAKVKKILIFQLKTVKISIQVAKVIKN